MFKGVHSLQNSFNTSKKVWRFSASPTSIWFVQMQILSHRVWMGPEGPFLGALGDATAVSLWTALWVEASVYPSEWACRVAGSAHSPLPWPMIKHSRKQLYRFTLLPSVGLLPPAERSLKASWFSVVTSLELSAAWDTLDHAYLTHCFVLVSVTPLPSVPFLLQPQSLITPHSLPFVHLLTVGVLALLAFITFSLGDTMCLLLRGWVPPCDYDG